MASNGAAAVLDAYTATTTRLREIVTRYVADTFTALGVWRDADIARFVQRVAPTITGAQLKIAAYTDAYLARIASLVLDEPVAPLGIPREVVSSTTIRGVTTQEVYGRMGPTVWNALANGHTIDEAVTIATARATSSVNTDLQLAKTHTVAYVTDNADHVHGYLRVPDGNACDLCLLAADQTYSRGDLMPIHERCGCDVEPYFTSDAERTASPPPDAPSDSDLEIAVHEHGELGPVLTVAGQTFTGPGDF